jgi:hypothetical protein
MAQANSGIGNVIPNTELVQMAMSYARSRMLWAAARLGVADAPADEVRSADDLAKTCQGDVDAPYRLLRGLASIRVMEETHRGIFGYWSLLTDCIRRASLPHRCVIVPRTRDRSVHASRTHNRPTREGHLIMSDLNMVAVTAVENTAPSSGSSPGWSFSGPE